jgi:hypothetical protein
MPNGTGWRTEQEHLSYIGDGGVQWVTKCHAQWDQQHNHCGPIWFSNGHPGQPDHDGDMPIIVDGEGKKWWIKDPTYVGTDRVRLTLVPVP